MRRRSTGWMIVIAFGPALVGFVLALVIPWLIRAAS